MQIRERPSEIGAMLSGAGLPLIARRVTDGFLAGIHRGTRYGEGIEFSQFRGYQPGDDLRRIDWKMYGRSDRFYIKEAETDSSVTVRFFLDSSASMLYSENGYTRIQYGALLTASLAALAHRQGDAVALHIVNSRTNTKLDPSRGKNQLNHLYNKLEQVKCEGTWPEETEWLSGFINRRKELWIVCSDMLDGSDTWKLFSDLATTSGHEIRFMQILGRKELDLTYDSVVTLKDPESGDQQVVNADRVREKYIENLSQYLKELDISVTGRYSKIFNVTMDEPVVHSLHKFLLWRAKI